MNTKFFATALVALGLASTLVLSGCMETSSTESTEPVAVEEMPAEGAMSGAVEAPEAAATATPETDAAAPAAAGEVASEATPPTPEAAASHDALDEHHG